DEQFIEDHYDAQGLRVTGKTPIGIYTEKALSLNRLSLRKLRDIRARLYDSADYVLKGLQALQGYSLDSLPYDIRHRVVTLAEEAGMRYETLADDLNEYLIKCAKSALLDDDRTEDEVAADEKTARERLRELRQWDGISAGGWTGRKARRASAAAPK